MFCFFHADRDLKVVTLSLKLNPFPIHLRILHSIELHFSPPCQHIASNCPVFLYSCPLTLHHVSAHHVSEVCRQFLDLLKLFDLLRVQVLLQLPRRLLVRETAPFHQVMGHLLQQHPEKNKVFVCVCVCASVPQD